jgi:hypothetical protein
MPKKRLTDDKRNQALYDEAVQEAKDYGVNLSYFEPWFIELNPSNRMSIKYKAILLFALMGFYKANDLVLMFNYKSEKAFNEDFNKKIGSLVRTNLGFQDGKFDMFAFKEQILAQNHIQGRIGYDYFNTLNVIALWNKTVKQSLLQNCLRDLMIEVHVKEEDLVQFGNNTSQAVSEILNNIPSSQAKGDVAPNLHIMMPDQKKAALQRMMGDIGGKKSGWQQGMEKLGAITPGQKWWAATSEGFSFKNFLELNP